MIKRMASKITAHIGGGHHYQSPPPQHQHPGKTVGLPPPSPAASMHSYSDSTSVTRINPGTPVYEHRESISTQRTSTSMETDSSQPVIVPRDPNAPAQARFPGRKTQRPKGTYRLTDFIIQRTLGTGSFWTTRSKHNLRFYAIKVLNKERIVKLKQVEHTNNEMMMLESVQHPFIINLWGSFQDSGNLYMVMDFVPGGELFTLLRRSNRFPDPVAKFYSAEVALALNYLHGLDIVYRDLKPENILLNTDGHVKIADFGFAKSCETTTWTLCGTPDYLAPEIVSQQRYNKSVDWYALGVLIYEMLSGLPPYHQQVPHHIELYEKIMQGPRYIRWPTAFNENATDLILKLMESDPSRRYGNLRHGAGDVFAHPWFKEVDWDKLGRREIMAPYLPRITGEGDASAFDNYPEDNVAAAYGLPAPDMFGSVFPNFEYTSPTIMS
ncbi:kinase-like protein [Coprinellus micaceus]|uniref:cAMP-dependent protein kinase n=1 Tax=Coprinellus micaceus TaxID=71717 RepID=A0A4Y7TX26_COPMI|nr:kinase-like protein [Coprinellus micaceus]